MPRETNIALGPEVKASPWQAAGCKLQACDHLFWRGCIIVGGVVSDGAVCGGVILEEEGEEDVMDDG